MGKLHLCFERKTLIVGAVIGISAACFPTARGQAVVSYGVSAGRAAGAGAAAGTGAAGIFDKLNRTTADAATHEAKAKPAVKTNPALVPRASSPNAITVGGSKTADAPGESGVVRTASGISIAGLTTLKPGNGSSRHETAEAGDIPDSASAAQPANPFAEPDGFRLPEVPLPDPAPIALAPQSPEDIPAGVSKMSRGGQDEVETHAAAPRTPLPSPAKTPALVVAQGITSKAGAPATSATPPTISAGTAIQDVIKLLGQPLMRLSGVEGADYDERFVFLTAGGMKLTILAHDGLVVKVIAE